MTKDPLFIFMVLCLAAVLLVLVFGLSTFGRGGEFNRKYANKAMRWRIIAQFIAILSILLFVWVTGGL